MSLATHYKLDIPTGAHKAYIRKTVTSYLVDEDIVSKDDEDATTDLELKKLEYQE